MEPKFQTSFIPKKQVASVGGLTGSSTGSGPMQQKAKANLTSAYMAVAVIVFFGRFFLAAPDRLLGWFGLMVITQLLLILLLDYLHEQSPTHRS